MRSNEERVAEVKRRIAEKERQKKLRRSRIAAVSAVAACLVLILVLSLFMPGIAGQLRPGGYSDYEMAASMFGENGALGYHHRADGLSSRCVRDHFMFPYPPAEPGRTEHGG